MVVDVVGVQHFAREFLQIKILFVGGVVGTNYPEAAPIRQRQVELLGDRLQGLRPGNLFQLAIYAHHGGLQPFRMVVEIERVSSLDAQELAVDPGVIAIIAADDAIVARTESGLAAVATMSADGADVRHLPGPRLVAIDPAGQRAHRADVDAGAALIALQVVSLIRSDLRKHATIDDAERAHPQALVADANAAETQDAAWG